MYVMYVKYVLGYNLECIQDLYCSCFESLLLCCHDSCFSAVLPSSPLYTLVGFVHPSHILNQLLVNVQGFFLE